MSLTNPNTPVSQQDLQDFYNKIKPYMGIYPSSMGQRVGKGDIYSTSERLIGQWIDGKPIYQKTVTGINANLEWNQQYYTLAWIDPVATDVDKILNCSLMRTDPLFTQVNVSVIIGDASHVGKWGLTCATSGVYTIITIQYTKTTDSAISIGDETDYSTEEKIVGTWIDGKPLYQKTITDTRTVSSNDTVTFDISSLSVDVLTNGWVMTQYPVQTGAYELENTLYTNNDKTQLMVKEAWSSSQLQILFIITIQYTKTT